MRLCVQTACLFMLYAASELYIGGLIMAVTIFGIGCGVAVLIVCIAYAVWYLSPAEDADADAQDKPSAARADTTEQ